VPAFGLIAESQSEQIINYMTDYDIVSNDHGTLWLGLEGEQYFDWHNFMELFSLFNSTPMFKVKFGQTQLGEIHEYTFFLGNEERIKLLLGGKHWEVTHIDWEKIVAYVHPTVERGKSRWPGDSSPLSFRLCRAIRGVLVDHEIRENWSRLPGLHFDDSRTMENSWRHSRAGSGPSAAQRVGLCRHLLRTDGRGRIVRPACDGASELIAPVILALLAVASWALRPQRRMLGVIFPEWMPNMRTKNQPSR